MLNLDCQYHAGTPKPLPPRLRGVEEIQSSRGGKVTVFFGGIGTGVHLHVTGRRAWPIARRPGEGGDDFIRPRIAQALGRMDDVFGSAPKDDDFQIRKLRSQF